MKRDLQYRPSRQRVPKQAQIELCGNSLHHADTLKNGGHAWTRTKGYPKRGDLQSPAIAAMRRAHKMERYPGNDPRTQVWKTRVYPLTPIPQKWCLRQESNL